MVLRFNAAFIPQPLWLEVDKAGVDSDKLQGLSGWYTTNYDELSLPEGPEIDRQHQIHGDPMKKRTKLRSFLATLALISTMTVGLVGAVGMAGPMSSEAEAISNCQKWNYTLSTRVKCHSTAGNGNRVRAAHFCTDGSYGFYQYGGWKMAGYLSIAQVCYATISGRGWQIGQV